MSDVSANNIRIAKNTLFLYIRLLFATVVGLYTSRVVLAVPGNDIFGLSGIVGSIVVMFYFLIRLLLVRKWRSMLISRLSRHRFNLALYFC